MASHVDEHQMTTTDGREPSSGAATPTRPIFDLRCGGVRVTVERIPPGVLTLINSASALALGAGIWSVR